MINQTLTPIQLQQADKIIAQLGTGADAVAAARGLAGAEQNFNPFLVSIPSICGDPTLPTTAILRGVVPLIDPAVTGSDLENANAKLSLTSPFPADGLSVAQVMIAQGFSNFTAKDLSGAIVNLSGGAAAAPVAVSTTAAAVSTVAAVVTSAAPAATCK